MDKQTVITVLRRVLDPEHPINIVDMGLVRPEDVTITENEIQVEFKPTSPVCPMGAVIGMLIRKALEDASPGVRVVVRLKPGSHLQEAACNGMISDDQQYQETIEKLAAGGHLDRLILKE
jgi:metal-sulfur cluster biosynthetic enzyme